ncbi:hypothetical protein BDV28DRAFT_148467 [Aspergillus coremiiformis]|uniref:F-box domain-containing protein n=1 Tax=Aspergillus coremiiformis TaxID=138285 RepID=A0A5N6Z788_9EURO|nr:hypothetical protein BDV28DRAFT_148467 [Aspergillus coremiiformis]
MAEKETHRIFLIPEILEKILLHTDIGTLLTSAQRVCCYWNALIQRSSPLQEALFFKPVEDNPRHGTKRIRNPLLESRLWPQLFRKRFRFLKARPNVPSSSNFPKIDPIDEDVYLRDGASWRRMLIQQPPTRYMGIVELHSTWGRDDLTLTQIGFKHGGGSLLMGRLYWGIVFGALVPQQEMWVFCEGFWCIDDNMDCVPRAKRRALLGCLADCEVVIITESLHLYHEGYLIVERPLDRWLGTLQDFQINKKIYRKLI